MGPFGVAGCVSKRKGLYVYPLGNHIQDSFAGACWQFAPLLLSLFCWWVACIKLGPSGSRVFDLVIPAAASFDGTCSGKSGERIKDALPQAASSRYFHPEKWNLV